jgi:hypothetical protein
MSDEASTMLRISIFGLACAVVYWYLTYEAFGTLGLLTLGLGPGFAGLIMWSYARRESADRESLRDLLWRFAGLPRGDRPGEDQEAAPGPLTIIPTPSVWPFVISIGIAVCLTGLIFGAWLVVIGGVFVAWGTWGWIAAVNRETAVSGRLAAAPPRPPDAQPRRH